MARPRTNRREFSRPETLNCERNWVNMFTQQCLFDECDEKKHTGQTRSISIPVAEVFEAYKMWLVYYKLDRTRISLKKFGHFLAQVTKEKYENKMVRYGNGKTLRSLIGVKLIYLKRPA